MRRSSITRTILRAGLLVVAVAPVFGVRPALASGGGGCGRPLTDRTGVAVRIKDFCFGPTVIRVSAGQSVTWTNRDPFVHTVLGANGLWGSFRELGLDESVTYRFVRPGVFPYACTIHVGMVAAVVVGRAPAPAPGSSQAVPVAEVGPTRPSGAVATVPAVAARDRLTTAHASPTGVGRGRSDVVGWVAVSAELVLLVVLAAFANRRRALATQRATTAA